MTETTNGNSLPADRQAAVEYGLTQFQTIAAERDEARRENIELRTKLAEHQAVLEVAELNNTQLESRVRTAILDRDQAIADRAVYETLFVAAQALFRAFQIPNAPLVKEHDALDDSPYPIRADLD